MGDWKFPSGAGWIVAELAVEPSDFATRCGIEFTRELDDLGWADIAWTNLDKIGPVLFERYEDAPVAGVTVTVDGEVTRDNALAALERQLQFTLDDFDWITPEPTWKATIAAANRATREARPGIG
jgi:hypothetical protein